jgi:hypothetical protein
MCTTILIYNSVSSILDPSGRFAPGLLDGMYGNGLAWCPVGSLRELFGGGLGDLRPPTDIMAFRFSAKRKSSVTFISLRGTPEAKATRSDSEWA